MFFCKYIRNIKYISLYYFFYHSIVDHEISGTSPIPYIAKRVDSVNKG